MSPSLSRSCPCPAASAWQIRAHHGACRSFPYPLGFSQCVLFLCLSCSMAWASFTCCMASAVTTLNTYTKTVLEFKRNHIKGYNGSLKDPPQHHQCFIQQQISSYYEPQDKPLRSVSEGVDFYSELQQKVLQREPELGLDEVLGQTIREDHC